jgi:hypothetical protein
MAGRMAAKRTKTVTTTVTRTGTVVMARQAAAVVSPRASPLRRTRVRFATCRSWLRFWSRFWYGAPVYAPAAPGCPPIAAHRNALTAVRSTMRRREGSSAVDDFGQDYPWVGTRDERFTLALVLDVGEVLSRHGYPAPTGATLVELTAGIYRALNPTAPPYLPPHLT